LHLIVGAAGIGAALVIGIGAKQYLVLMKASQVRVVQNNLGLAVASSDKGNADRTVRPVPDAGGVERADDQPLMATGLDLNGPPKRFPAKEQLENLEIPGF
jgi:hypothetical protein